MRYRILALDLDGTLLDPRGAVTDSVREAVASASRRGVRVVLCTGRRFRTALPMARVLGLGGAIVVNNGVLVKDLESGRTLHHRYLPADVVPEVVALLRRRGAPLVYVDRHAEELDILTERLEHAHPFQREYLDDNTAYVRAVDDVGASAPDDVIMVSTMADESTLAELDSSARDQLGDRVRTLTIINKNYRGSILEFLSPASSKWVALERLAAEEGVGPEAIAAVGDDTNDVEMIARAGLGVAMGNAVAAAKQAADLVVGSNAEGGAAQAIRRILAL